MQIMWAQEKKIENKIKHSQGKLNRMHIIRKKIKNYCNWISTIVKKKKTYKTNLYSHSH